jgi:curli production assembly/transport component CsgE
MVLFASVILSALINPLNVPVDSLKNKPVPTELMNIVEQATKHSVKSNDVEIEIDGLLVDDTKTKAGKDFYDFFCSTWDAPVAAKNYSITVSEKPFRLSSTIVTVLINDILVYQAILQPRQDVLEAMTVEAILMTQEYLVNYEEIMKQINGDDLSGSGIY